MARMSADSAKSKSMTDPHERDLHALIELLHDDDSDVRAQVVTHLAQFGDSGVRALERAMGTTDALHRARIQLAHEAVLRDRVLDRLREFALRTNDAHEEYGAALVAQVFIPTLDTSHVLGVLDRLAETCPTEAQLRDPRVSLRAMRRYVHTEHGFRGNRTNYYDPQNSLLNRVLERRIGIPITLAVLYLAIARRIGQTAYGIGLPGHFLVRWTDAEPAVFVDPFNAGAMLTAEECERLVKQNGLNFAPEQLSAVTARETVARIARNLVAAWRKSGESESEALAREVHACLRPDVVLPP